MILVPCVDVLNFGMMKKNNTDCYIADNTHWIIGTYPIEFNPLIELYNTWICFFTKERIEHMSFRYLGTRGDAIETDTVRLGNVIVEYLNNGYKPNIGMLSFMEDIKNSRAFDRGFYEKAKAWFPVKDAKYHVHPEQSFFKMINLFKVHSLKNSMDELGINISFNVTA